MKRIAGIDVHKKILAVVIIDAASPEMILQKGKFGTGHAELERLRTWLQQAEVVEVVMESTAQYWRPVWTELEPYLALHLAHAQSNRAPQGRKSDWADAKRLVKRLVADELFLSFVPEPEQRDWGMLTRARQALLRDHVHLQNQIEALLEQASIKLSSVVSDLFGVSGLRILQRFGRRPDRPRETGRARGSSLALWTGGPGGCFAGAVPGGASPTASSGTPAFGHSGTADGGTQPARRQIGSLAR